MKRLAVILSVLTIVVMSCQDTQKYTIKGTINGADSVLVYLSIIENQSPLNIDSCMVTNGQFTIEGNKSLSEFAMLTIGKGRPFASLFLEPVVTTVTADMRGHETSNVDVKGGNATKLNNDIDNLFKELSAKRGTLANQFREAANNGDTVAMANITSEFENMTKEVVDKMFNSLNSDSSNLATPFITANTGSNYLNFEQQKEIYDKLSPEVKASKYGVKLGENIEKMSKTQIGEIAPDFTMADSEGNNVSLSSLKGKYILLDFWASWCGPCRAENPNVVAAYNAYKDKNFDILGVSLDDNKDKWLEAIEADKLAWHHVSDLKGWKNEASQLYGIRGIPANYLLDPEGKILAKDLRGEELEKKLNEILN
ncbi:MAG: redoxin domain-containing protein [Bacteroidales bacterium]